MKKTSKFLKLTRFVIDRFITDPENQAAIYRINNPSQEVLTPKGEIIVYDTQGGEVTSIPVNPDSVSINPGEYHDFVASVPIASMFGKYKAFLDVVYGDTQQASIQDTVFFYVFPIKKLLPILAVLLFVVALTAFFVHRRYYSDDQSSDDGSDFLHVRVKETLSEPKEHDIDLKKT